MVHPESGGNDGWIGLAESPAWKGDAEKDLRRNIVGPGCLTSASDQTKSGYKAKMVRPL